MRALSVGAAIAANGNGTGVATGTSPFGPRRQAVCAISPDEAWNGTITIQTSPDNSTWTTVSGVTVTGTNRQTTFDTIELDRYVRYVCASYVAGHCDVDLLGDL